MFIFRVLKYTHNLILFKKKYTNKFFSKALVQTIAKLLGNCLVFCWWEFKHLHLLLCTSHDLIEIN
jgi:hypothetical protein